MKHNELREEKEAVEESGRARWRIGFLAAVGAVAVTGIAVALWQPAWLTQLAGGPPAVEMKEVYEDRAGGPTFDHSTFDSLLDRYVDQDGGVDYEGLRTHREELQHYIHSLGDAPFDELSRNGKLALLINAYNAFTIALILEHWPLESIRDIPEEERWDDPRWKIGSHVWSLNQIEHEQIRPSFVEPRIHFALVCAAVGCPPLRTEAYRSDRLDSQLTEQAEYVHRHDRWLQYDAAHPDFVQLTPLYRWYSGDFEQVAGSLLQFAARYAPDLSGALKAGATPEIRWLSYDWSLNTPENIP